MCKYNAYIIYILNVDTLCLYIMSTYVCKNVNIYIYIYIYVYESV